jgi:hypothetical protein
MRAAPVVGALGGLALAAVMYSCMASRCHVLKLIPGARVWKSETVMRVVDLKIFYAQDDQCRLGDKRVSAEEWHEEPGWYWYGVVDGELMQKGPWLTQAEAESNIAWWTSKPGENDRPLKGE